MRFLVCSDSHGNYRALTQMLTRANTARFPADAVCFLGDGLSDLLSLPALSESGLTVFRVRGNCDWRPFASPEEELLTMEGHKLLMMHGHRLSVKSGTDAAIRYALEKGADILLYGHTHTPEEFYYPEGTSLFPEGKNGPLVLPHPLWVLNPGSIGVGGVYGNGFGVLEFGEDGVLWSRVTL